MSLKCDPFPVGCIAAMYLYHRLKIVRLQSKEWKFVGWWFDLCCVILSWSLIFAVILIEILQKIPQRNTKNAKLTCKRWFPNFAWACSSEREQFLDRSRRFACQNGAFVLASEWSSVEVDCPPRTSCLQEDFLFIPDQRQWGWGIVRILGFCWKQNFHNCICTPSPAGRTQSLN